MIKLFVDRLIDILTLTITVLNSDPGTIDRMIKFAPPIITAIALWVVLSSPK